MFRGGNHGCLKRRRKRVGWKHWGKNVWGKLVLDTEGQHGYTKGKCCITSFPHGLLQRDLRMCCPYFSVIVYKTYTIFVNLKKNINWLYRLFVKPQLNFLTSNTKTNMWASRNSCTAKRVDFFLCARQFYHLAKNLRCRGRDNLVRTPIQSYLILKLFMTNNNSVN